MAFQVTAGVAGAGFDPFEPFILGLFAVGSALLLGNVRGAEAPAGPAPHADRRSREEARA
jgi:hypothetical protein